MNNDNNEAGDLIEQAEALAGCRWDDPSGLGIAALFGAVAREMGRNPHGPKDDIAAGILLQHQMSARGRAERASNEMLAALLTMGLGPDDIAALSGSKRKRGE
jgi:hypothetical protein